jgi:subtilisin family serine protease
MIVAPMSGVEMSHRAIHRFASGAMLIETDESAESLMATGLYRYAEPDYIVYLDTVPNDPYYDPNWMYAPFRMHAADAWSVTTGDPNILVGVIDSGAGPHPDLDANLRPGINVIDPNRSWADDGGHGSHVSGIIGAVGNNGNGVVGVAWRVGIVPLKAFNGCGTGTTADIIEALDWATAHGIKVTNNSWSGGGASQALLASLNAFCSAGGIFVVSAGNSGLNIDTTPWYPVALPASCIFAVAATDVNDALASFSNYGPLHVPVAAPGVSIFSTIPSGYMCSGLSGGPLGYKSGTSMAAPQAVGAVVLVWSAFPTMTNMEVIDRLISTSDPIPALVGKVASGGRINLAAAVGFTGPPDPPAAFCGNGTCDPAESCKDCDATRGGDCARVRKPRQSKTCCGDNRLDPGDLIACPEDP